MKQPMTTARRARELQSQPLLRNFPSALKKKKKNHLQSCKSAPLFEKSSSRPGRSSVTSCGFFSASLRPNCTAKALAKHAIGPGLFLFLTDKRYASMSSGQRRVKKIEKKEKKKACCEFPAWCFCRLSSIKRKKEVTEFIDPLCIFHFSF